MSRDTELYRILNMHYNKSNVYQVSEQHGLNVHYSESGVYQGSELYGLNVHYSVSDWFQGSEPRSGVS